MSDKDKQRLRKLKTRPVDRNLAMTKMGVMAGTQVAGHMFMNLFRGGEEKEARDREFFVRQAQFLADELGQLKGSVMKVGQMLSLYGQYFMPPEAIKVLSSLQDDTAHVDWEFMEPVLHERLSLARLAELDIDKEPLAAASLGQVHVATRCSDGQKLCIKMQYPGLADAIDSDVRTMTRLVTMARIVPKGIELMPVMDEVQDMLHQEVDYQRELKMTQMYAERYKEDPRYITPMVFPEYSSEHLLTTSFEAGVHVQDASVQNLPQERRNQLALNALHLFFDEFFNTGWVQTDPHFGNYRIRLDEREREQGDSHNDQIVMLDFGATRQFRDEFLKAYWQIIHGALYRDSEQLLEGALGIGLLRPEFPEAVRDAFVEVCFLIIEPFADPAVHPVPEHLLTPEGAYKWGESDLPKRASTAIAKAAISRYFRVPPREIVFLHRRLGGVFILLAVLGAEIKGREVLQQALAGAKQFNNG